MKRQRKERAAATANSDHPAKETLHKAKYSISPQQIQERFTSNNGRILRLISTQRIQYTPVKNILAVLKESDINVREASKSIWYLDGKGYIRITQNGKAVQIAPQGIQLLAGNLQDGAVKI